jgi:CSLREA domain-containing protein
MAIAVGAVASAAGAATFTVNSRADGADAMAGDGSCATSGGTCTLRAAIEEANALVGSDTITLPSGLYRVKQGELLISGDVVINGAGSANSIIDAGYSSRVLDVSGSVANITGVRIRHGKVVDDCGGGIYVGLTATLILSNSIIAFNWGRSSVSSVTGGGLCNDGQATLTNVRVVRNRLLGGVNNDTDGGGIENSGTLTLNNTEVSKNRISGGGGSWDQGGGLSNYGTLNVNQVVVAGNHVRAGDPGGSSVDGAGLYNEGTISGSNLTLDRNVGVSTTSYANGGGFSTFGSLGNVTLSGLTATRNRIVSKGSGGYGNGAGIHAAGGTLNLDHVISIRNRAIGGGFAYGGGIDIEGGTLTLTSGFVSRNVVVGTTDDANPCGAGVSVGYTASVILTDVVISFNRVLGVGASDSGLCGVATLNNVVISQNRP